MFLFEIFIFILYSVMSVVCLCGKFWLIELVYGVVIGFVFDGNGLWCSGGVGSNDGFKGDYGKVSGK